MKPLIATVQCGEHATFQMRDGETRNCQCGREITARQASNGVFWLDVKEPRNLDYGRYPANPEIVRTAAVSGGLLQEVWRR